MWKKTRYIALFSHIMFHTMNNNIFSIGTFPFMMLASSILWFDADYVGNWLKKKWNIFGESKIPSNSISTPSSSRIQKIFILFHILLQTLIPLSAYTLTSDPNWTNANSYFTWRMMLNEEVTFISLNYQFLNL